MAINWTITNPNLSWTNKVNGIDVVENYFDEASALSLLLNNEVVIINSLWWHRYNWSSGVSGMTKKELCDNPISEKLSKQISLAVICNDAFYPSADCTELEYSEIEDLYNHYIKDPIYGTYVWSMKKEKIPLMSRHMKNIKEQGIWNLEEIMSTWTENKQQQ